MGVEKLHQGRGSWELRSLAGRKTRDLGPESIVRLGKEVRQRIVFTFGHEPPQLGGIGDSLITKDHKLGWSRHVEC